MYSWKRLAKRYAQNELGTEGLTDSQVDAEGAVVRGGAPKIWMHQTCGTGELVVKKWVQKCTELWSIARSFVWSRTSRGYLSLGDDKSLTVTSGESLRCEG